LLDTAATKTAFLLADDALSDEEVAAAVKCSRSQLARWNRHPQFAARVTEIRDGLTDLLSRHEIARKHWRVRQLNSRWKALERIIERRAANPEIRALPGGDTGLIVRQRKMLGTGDNAVPIVEAALDTGLLKEMRELEKQAAIECGQWVEKQDLTSQGKRLPIQFVVIKSSDREDYESPEPDPELENPHELN
jgi:hypothetical protein